MRAIPTLFRLDEFLGGKASSHPFNRYARQILDGTDVWVPRRKRNGMPMLLDAHGNWQEGVKIHHRDRTPTGFVETYCGKRLTEDGTPKFRFGWAPASTARVDVLRRALLLDAPALEPGESYELCGPGICGNFEKLKAPRLFQHSAAEICVDLYDRPLTYDYLRGYFRRTLAGLGWEGIVWHGPVPSSANPVAANALMIKLRVNDFVLT